MSKNISKIAAILIAAIVPMLFAYNAKAEQCFTQYGGGETCVSEDAKLKVEKSIWHPEKDDWMDHIDSKSYTFSGEEKIEFRIKVTNVGDVKIENIDLVDHLPSYVKYKDGDGDGKSGDTKVEFDEFDLEPGESEEFEFTARVADDGVLPKDDKICLSNIAKAKGEREDNGDKEEAVDYANFCIDLPKVKSKKEKPTVLPKTGADVTAGALAIGLISVGYGIKKLIRDEN